MSDLTFAMENIVSLRITNETEGISINVESDPTQMTLVFHLTRIDADETSVREFVLNDKDKRIMAEKFRHLANYIEGYYER